MKKVVLILTMILTLCCLTGCNRKIDENIPIKNNESQKDISQFIGTWNYVSSTYSDYEINYVDEGIKEELNIEINENNSNLDFGWRPGLYFIYENELLEDEKTNSYKYSCYKIDNNNLIQKKCSENIKDYVNKKDEGKIEIAKELEMYNITYEKVH